MLQGCAHTAASRQAQLEKTCTPILENILDIQDTRNIMGSMIQDAIVDLRSGRINIDEFHHIRLLWLENENSLRSDVDNLYSKAYSLGCMD
jgi:hypothetical protein